MKFALFAASIASVAVAHLPLQEGAKDTTHSEPLKIETVCRHDQEHAIYGNLDSETDVDVYELVVPEDSPDFFLHVALPVLPFDPALVKYGDSDSTEDRRRTLFPSFLRAGPPPKDTSDFPKCPGNDARPLIAVVGPGIKTDVGKGRWSAAFNNGCGRGRNRLPFYVAADEGVVVTEFSENNPYYEEFESGFTVVGKKNFVDLKAGTYKFYVWDAYGRKGDYLAVFGKNEDCYADGKGYGPVGKACEWMVQPDFHSNCGARPAIPACCCFLPLGMGVCPTDKPLLDQFCKDFRIGGRTLPFLENGSIGGPAVNDEAVTPVENDIIVTPVENDSEIVVVACEDKLNNPFASCADLKEMTGCDGTFSNAFVTIVPADECKKTCGLC